MAYRAFIAATFRDLASQRLCVIDQLKKAEIEVESMEKWSARHEEPKEFSTKSILGCHFCIVLVAFRRGHVPANQPDGKSITQMEVDFARRNGIPLFVYLLDETTQNSAEWPAEMNELNLDPAVRAWRHELRERHTIEVFNANEPGPNVLKAITPEIVKRELRHRRRMYATLSFSITTVALFLLVLFLAVPVQKWTISRLLPWYDGTVFQHSRTGHYDFCRLIPKNSDLRETTDFKVELNSTVKSFDVLANTGEIFRNFKKEFEDMASRKVRIRIILSDTSEANQANFESFARAVDEKDMGESYSEARNIRHIIQGIVDDIERAYPGEAKDLIQVRLNRKPLLYTMWVRDFGHPNSLAHLSVHYYETRGAWPCFRFSPKTGAEMLVNLDAQFDKAWRDAVPYVGEYGLIPAEYRVQLNGTNDK